LTIQRQQRILAWRKEVMSKEGISLLEKQQYLKDRIKNNAEDLIQEIIDEHDIYTFINFIQEVCLRKSSEMKNKYKTDRGWTDLGWEDACRTFGDVLDAIEVIPESEIEPEITRFNN